MRKLFAVLAIITVALAGCKKGDEWWDVTTLPVPQPGTATE